MDKAWLLWINQDWAHPWLDVFFDWVSQRYAFALPMLIVILLLLAWRHRSAGVKLWLALVIVVGTGDAVGNLLKHLIAEPRPCVELHEVLRQPGRPAGPPCDDYMSGMPSNHALNFFAAALFLALALRSWTWGINMFIVATLVALSRVYLGKHYPSQVLAGAGIGSLIGLFGAWISLKYLPFIQRLRAARGQPKANHDAA